MKNHTERIKGEFMKSRMLTAGILLGLLIPTFLSAGINIVGELTHEKKVLPGDTLEGKIVVINTGDDIQEVKVYQTDYLFYCSGKNIYGKAGKDPRSNAAWISLDRSRVSIDPKAQIEIYYKMRVPKADTLAGTFWSMIMIEGIPQLTPDNFKKASVGINTVMRYGIQIVTQVGETGNRQLKFIDAKLFSQNEKKVFQVDIENTGDQWLRPSVWVEIYDLQGVQLGKYQGVQLRTYPGTSIRQKFELDEMPKGTYKALVVADCGGDDLFGMNCKLEMK